MKKINTKMLVTCGLLVALHIILSRFLSINAWNIKIGLAFAATYIGAYLYGPIAGVLVGGLGDFLGAILFPIGAYFPGFTLNCALTGLVFGLILYKKQTKPGIALSVAIDQLGISLWITPLWISILYGSPYWPLIISRLPQIGVMLVIETAGIIILTRVMKRIKARKMVKGDELTPEQKARRALRSSRIAARNALTDEERTDLSRKLCAGIAESEEFLKAKNILIYKGYKGEVRLEELENLTEKINSGLEMSEKKVLSYPLCVSDTEMIPLVPEGPEAWKEGYKGIMEPERSFSKELAPEELDMIICPCTVFDEKGGRMGQGGGFYDRYLGQIDRSRVKIALVAFECQKADSVLAESWDKPVDMAYTEEKIYRFK